MVYKKIYWHSISSQDVLAELKVTVNGLRNEDVAKRLRKYGSNTLTKDGSTSTWLIFWNQVNTPIGWLLIAAGALAVVLNKPTDAVVVFGAVCINAIIGFTQEYRAGKAIEALAAMVPEAATVLRNGQAIALPAEGLVPGDIVMSAI
ncbi:hypothetical protein GTA51_19590 [Desulfovibrio aerotolerans]|uniref:Cation-transporting P-type ATPase N-terminal domain-containing protein n=1 Tax=Solidesulfovibrio aerotolerans TaxID=295255 RepID=A0A7C9IND5_9BACT|nr:cation-transporting P-type ATPase [Solidesulfovibrio aerotolerans]MYL85301.1 hypothetical protein [Solidesulfovibrio aerotolerans]